MKKIFSVAILGLFLTMFAHSAAAQTEIVNLSGYMYVFGDSHTIIDNAATGKPVDYYLSFTKPFDEEYDKLDITCDNQLFTRLYIANKDYGEINSIYFKPEGTGQKVTLINLHENIENLPEDIHFMVSTKPVDDPTVVNCGFSTIVHNEDGELLSQEVRIKVFVLPAKYIDSPFSTIEELWKMRGFDDVPSTHPNYEAILDLTKREIVSGYPDGTFKPENTVNRAELAKMLSIGNQYFVRVGGCFPDVPTTSWFGRYVCEAHSEGWVQGYEDGLYRPEQPVSRVEAIKMVLHANSVQISEQTTTPWYEQYIPYAREYELLFNDTALANPNEHITRSELSEIIYRTYHQHQTYLWDKFTGASDEFIQDWVDFVEHTRSLGGGKLTSHDVNTPIKIDCSQETYQKLEQLNPLIQSLDIVSNNELSILTKEQSFFWNDDRRAILNLNIQPTNIFHLSVWNHCNDIAEDFVQNGANINDNTGLYGMTPLHLAAMTKNVHLAKKLIEHGADVNGTTTNTIFQEQYKYPIEYLRLFTKPGLSPLLFAVMQKDDEMVELLLENGADPNYKTPTDYHGSIQFPSKYNDLSGKMYEHKDILPGYSLINIVKNNPSEETKLEEAAIITLLKEYGADSN